MDQTHFIQKPFVCTGQSRFNFFFTGILCTFRLAGPTSDDFILHVTDNAANKLEF